MWGSMRSDSRNVCFRITKCGVIGVGSIKGRNTERKVRFWL